ncbi:hypothetical protein [Acidisoma sp. L85]|uniref:hypothetical protein n=1 Tax=Acidisoma sp. L85 TaxID=1641850 RepID=UPI0020B14E10|nr:hypothetical protein [Acidisoma sp. L85]
MAVAYLNGIGTSVSRNDVHDAFVRFANSFLEDPRRARLFRRMAERSGIAHRYSVLVPADNRGSTAVDDGGFYTRGALPSSARRMALYERTALPLALDVPAFLP